MAAIDVDLNAIGIRQVLRELPFPAPRWRIIAEASHWGAGCECLDELTALEARDYNSLRDLAQAIRTLRRHRGFRVVRSPLRSPNTTPAANVQSRRLA